MRSSIACVRCRRSKVKCVNSGVGTQCRSCEASGRECTYPVPVPGGRRREGSMSGQQARPENLVDVEVRKPRQHRKSNAGAPGQPLPPSFQQAASPTDPLDPNVLTPEVWQQLFEIFQLHFSTDLPFIHTPSFLKPLRQALQYSGPNGPTVQPPASTEFLLAFLALTARFHGKIVAHHSPATAERPSSALVASEYYAREASARLHASGTADKLGIYDLEATQAMLMLTLFEWGMNRGAKAWSYLGIAIRSAQAMGLHYEPDLDDAPYARTLPVTLGDRASVGSSDKSFVALSDNTFIQEEIKRRTFWTCFVLDRYLSNGKYRPQCIQSKDVRIQLPASEQAFLFGEKVRTLLLYEGQADAASRVERATQPRTPLMSEYGASQRRHSLASNGMNGSTLSGQAQGKWEAGPDEGLVSRYIKILDIYGRIVKWSCGGGRKRDKLPPWNPQSQWYALRKDLEDFRSTLPRQHLLTPQNTSAHINLRTSTPYTLVHTTFALCAMLIYREFLPFVPFRHGRPQGPLDAGSMPYFSALHPHAPANFWEDSARECLGAGRDVIDLIRTCQEWGASVETPVIGFAVYNVALLGIYLVNFPWMDTNGYLRRGNPSLEATIPGGAEAARMALDMLGPMKSRMARADSWVKTLKRTHKYFSRLRSVWWEVAGRWPGNSMKQAVDMQSIATAQLHPREGGESTRTLLEKALATLDDGDEEDGEMADAPGSEGMDSPHLKQDASNGPRTLATAPPLHEREQHQAQPQHQHHHVTTQEERWNAINSVASAALASANAAASSTSSPHPGTPSQTNSAHHNFRFFGSYQHSPNPASTPPAQHSTLHRPAGGSEASPQASLQTPSRPSPAWASTNGPLHGIQAYASSASSPGGGTSGAVQQPFRRPGSDREVRDPETWLAALERQFGGDDLVAFVDGVDGKDIAKILAREGRPGWLSVVWGYAS